MKTAMDIPDKEGQKRLVIVGGGFGGLKLARKLKSNKFQIVLLDKNNHHIFQPLLYQVATAGIEPSAISFPYRKIFKKESISIYVFVKHSKSSRNTICWRLPSARWHTTIGHCHRLQHKLFWKRRAGETDHGTKEYFGSLVQPKPDIG